MTETELDQLASRCDAASANERDSIMREASPKDWRELTTCTGKIDSPCEGAYLRGQEPRTKERTHHPHHVDERDVDDGTALRLREGLAGQT